MAVVIVITRPDKPEVQKIISLDRKLILGSSVYCDIVLEDKTIASMQCQFQPVKTGHVVATNLDLKKEVLINQSRLKKAALRVDDIMKIGPFILKIDTSQLTVDELMILNSEYEEFV
jgi:hypothetical protein